MSKLNANVNSSETQYIEGIFVLICIDFAMCDL